jgi:hypothetical protein
MPINELTSSFKYSLISCGLSWRSPIFSLNWSSISCWLNPRA